MLKLMGRFKPFTAEATLHPRNVTNFPVTPDVRSDDAKLARLAQLTKENHPSLVLLTQKIDAKLKVWTILLCLHRTLTLCDADGITGLHQIRRIDSQQSPSAVNPARGTVVWHGGAPSLCWDEL